MWLELSPDACHTSLAPPATLHLEHQLLAAFLPIPSAATRVAVGHYISQYELRHVLATQALKLST